MCSHLQTPLKKDLATAELSYLVDLRVELLNSEKVRIWS